MSDQVKDSVNESSPTENLHMRTILTAGALVFALAAAGYTAYDRSMKLDRETAITNTERSLAALRSQVRTRAGLGEGPFTDDGWPVAVKESWFVERPIANELLPALPAFSVEVAGEGERMLVHPPKPFVADHERAAFWYNPYLGIVRARVPYQRTDAETLALYNDVNDSELVTLFPQGPADNTRTAHVPDDR